MIRASEVAKKDVGWLWPGRIPRGFITLLDADPGTGKTTIALALAAAVSTGKEFAPGAIPGEPAGVLMYGSEDSLEHVLVPRLEAAGADRERIFIETLPMTFGDVARGLEVEIHRRAAKLVIFDPLGAFMGAGEKDYHGAHCALAPLVGVAERTNAAVLLIRHPTKSAVRAIYAGQGSVGIVGVARSALFAARSPEDPDEFVLAQTKNSLGKVSHAIRYRVDDPGVVVFGEECNITADDLLRAQRRGPSQTARTDARELLQVLLARGPVDANDAYRAARDAGLSARTLERAKAELGVASQRVDDRESARWMWRLPASGDEDRHVPDGDVAEVAAPVREDRHEDVGDLGVRRHE